MVFVMSDLFCIVMLTSQLFHYTYMHTFGLSKHYTMHMHMWHWLRLVPGLPKASAQTITYNIHTTLAVN